MAEVNSGVPLEKGAPDLSMFVLYAERSIRLGRHCQALEGDVGIRTPLQTSSDSAGPVQLAVGRHTRCCNLFSPSTSLEIYSEVRDVWTDSLQRVEDIGIGIERSFPGNMPELPLAIASGSGRDITLHRHQRTSLGPGPYGALTMLYESELWLAAGTYVFASIHMHERTRLIALPGGVNVGIVGGLWTDRHARIVLHGDDAKAGHFTISVAGSDPSDANDNQQQGGSQPIVVIGEEVHLHALLAAPHGTVQVDCEARIKGAIAAFDIAAADRVHAEFQSGFPVHSPGQQGSQQLTGYFGVPDPPLPLLGPVPQDTLIPLAISLPVRDPAGLNNQVRQVSDPKSPDFRKFVSQADFKNTYGATDADYQSLRNWADASGFTTVSTYSNNLLLSVRASAAAIEQALFVNLQYRQREDGSRFVTVDRNPSLNLSVPILQIAGLNDYFTPRNIAGTGGGGNLRAADLRTAYLGVSSPLQSLTRAGQVVGIVDWDVFLTTDISGYAALQVAAPGQPALPAPNVTIVNAEGGSNQPANSKFESTIDIEMVYAMAPAAQILFFQGSSGITGHLDDIFHAMATSSPALTVGSCSLGFWFSDGVNQALGQMALNGVSFFTASGDLGDIGTNDPQNLKCVNQTLVGGTSLSTNALQAPPNPLYPNPYYAGETMWNSSGASGGGIMNGVTIPDYQVGVSMAGNGGSAQFRNYPDVAMPAIGFEIFFNGGVGSGVGTSFAAPLWAGFMALVNQFNRNNGGAGVAGFINPTIYDIGLTSGSADDLYKVCFNDITSGNNGIGNGGSGFNAVAGYDLCTGWGSPKPGLINQLGSPTPLTPNQPLTLVRFIVTTGNDDAGGGLHGSDQTADCFLQGGGVFTVTLRHRSESNWSNGSVHQVDFPIPVTDSNGKPVPMLTETSGLTGVRINLVQSNPDISADNWDINALQVSLFSPGSPQVCQLNLVGTSVLEDGSTGLVRLSKSAGSSGSGPSSPVFKTGLGSGC